MTTNSYSRYRHTQPGTFIIALTLGLTIVYCVSAMLLPKPLWIAPAILLVIGWLFNSLTIEITGRELRWKFGPGLIRKSAPLAEIAEAKPIKTTILDGWGIHLSRFGWLYNVSGFNAVAITLRNGKKFALGTDEPQTLCAALLEQ